MPLKRYFPYSFLFQFFAFFFTYGDNPISIDHAIVSVYAVHSETGEVLIDQNSELSLVPASCMKLITSGAALQLLGANTRFETHLEYNGTIDRSKTLHGNIFIRGEGDPCLGSDRIGGSLSWENQLAEWADAIQKLGIKKIEGKVIGDASKWERALAAQSWAWEDLGNYYGAGACALAFHENYYSLFFKPASQIGEKAHVLRIDPPLSSLILQNECRVGTETSGDCACLYGSEFTPIRWLRGTIPCGRVDFMIKGAIPDPAGACADLLAKELQKRKIKIEDKKVNLRAQRTPIHTSYSPTIGEIIYWTNQKSLNLHAEHLLKKMGEEGGNKGSTASGIKAVTNFWKSKGIDLTGFRMEDGSGLSRKNLVTAKQLVSILLKMKESNFFPQFLESLPQKGEGVKAKSGSMSSVKCLAGYSEKTIFAIMINNCVDLEIMNEKVDLILSNLRELHF